MKKRYRRYRRYRRRLRPSKRRRVIAKIIRPEVKAFRITQNEIALVAARFTNATTTLHLEGTHLSDVISWIPQGTGSGARIGTKIFVKSINFTGYFSSCPRNLQTPSAGFSFNTSLFRMVWSTSRGLAGVAVPNFFISNVNNPIAGAIARKLFGCHYDKVYQWNDPIVAYKPANGTQTPGYGGAHKVSHTLKVNREVSFQPNDAGWMRNDSDVFTLHMFTYVPGMAQDIAFQTHCSDYRVTIYYTDD